VLQFSLSHGVLTPATDSAADMGTTLKRFKDFYVDNITTGTATISEGTIAGATLVVADNTVTTAASGNLTATELNAALAELQADVDTRALDADLTTHENDTTAHGATGAVVGTTNTQTLENKTLTTPILSGNTTTDGLIDGRDVATDGTKLDTIDTNANDYTHPAHSGDVVSVADGATTIQAGVVEEAMLSASVITKLNNTAESKFDATSAPDADDDSAGTGANGTFHEGSVWVDVTNDEAYRCVDDSVGAAVWINTTLTSSELGTMAVQNANAVAITGGTAVLTGGTITGITDLAVADGGTGASDASTARTNLGVISATDSAEGLVELATDAEAVAGVDTTRAITPAALQAALDGSPIAGNIFVENFADGVDFTTGVTTQLTLTNDPGS